jgi:hypothetical protein
MTTGPSAAKHGTGRCAGNGASIWPKTDLPIRKPNFRARGEIVWMERQHPFMSTPG